MTTPTPRAPSAPMTDEELLDAVATQWLAPSMSPAMGKYLIVAPAILVARKILDAAHAASTAALEAENAKYRALLAEAVGHLEHAGGCDAVCDEGPCDCTTSDIESRIVAALTPTPEATDGE